MSHVKAGGSSKNNRNNAGKRLGVKRSNQPVKEGEIIVRQNGSSKIPGTGAFISRDFTIHASKDGTVQFNQVKKKHFTGKTVKRTEVSIV